MNILFSKRGKGVIKWIWTVVAILIILSMLFTFTAGV